MVKQCRAKTGTKSVRSPDVNPEHLDNAMMNERSWEGWTSECPSTSSSSIKSPVAVRSKDLEDQDRGLRKCVYAKKTQEMCYQREAVRLGHRSAGCRSDVHGYPDSDTTNGLRGASQPI